jgi:putative transcriptional regulator
MSEFFNSIKQGLNEAVTYSKGNLSKAVVHKFSPLDVKNIRTNMGMSQTEFASAFSISVSTLCHWERGDREPQVVLNAFGELKIELAIASTSTTNFCIFCVFSKAHCCTKNTLKNK